MAKTKRQAAVDSAVQSIIGGGQSLAKAKRPNPLGVLLEPDEIAQLDRAAAELSVSRHALLLYAVRQFLAGWERGERPEFTTKAVSILKIN